MRRWVRSARRCNESRGMGQRYSQHPTSLSHSRTTETGSVKGRTSPHFLASAGRRGRSSVPAFDSCEIEIVERTEDLGIHAARRQPYYHREWHTQWTFVDCVCPAKPGLLTEDGTGDVFAFLVRLILGFWRHAPGVLVPGDCGAQSEQGAPGGESGRVVWAGAPQAEAGGPSAGGAGPGTPPAPGSLRRRAGVFQQLGAGKLDTEAPAGKKKFIFLSSLFGFQQSCHVGSHFSPPRVGHRTNRILNIWLHNVSHCNRLGRRTHSCFTLSPFVWDDPYLLKKLLNLINMGSEWMDATRFCFSLRLMPEGNEIRGWSARRLCHRLTI